MTPPSWNFLGADVAPAKCLSIQQNCSSALRDRHVHGRDGRGLPRILQALQSSLSLTAALAENWKRPATPTNGPITQRNVT
jgi:hypothetical protein